jgi:hypothetical protein
MLQRYNIDVAEFRRDDENMRPMASAKLRKNFNQNQGNELEVISEAKGSTKFKKEKPWIQYRKSVADRILMTFGDMEAQGNSENEASVDDANVGDEPGMSSVGTRSGKRLPKVVQAPRNAALNQMAAHMGPREPRPRTRDAERPWSKANPVKPIKEDDDFRPALGVRLSKYAALPEVGGRNPWTSLELTRPDVIADTMNHSWTSRESARPAGPSDTMYHPWTSREPTRPAGTSDTIYHSSTPRESARPAGTSDAMYQSSTSRESARRTGTADAMQRTWPSRESARPAGSAKQSARPAGTSDTMYNTSLMRQRRARSNDPRHNASKVWNAPLWNSKWASVMAYPVRLGGNLDVEDVECKTDVGHQSTQ